MIVTISNSSIVPQKKTEFLQIKINELQKFDRKNILRVLLRRSEIVSEKTYVNIVTRNPRNYLLDMQFSEDMELSEKCLPIQVQLIKPQKEYEIQSFTSVNLNFFNILMKIGEGTYSQIFLVERKYDRSLFVLKRINKGQCLRIGSLDFIKNQQQILKKIRSKWNVKLYYSFQDKIYAYLIIQFCPYGDLYSLLNRSQMNLTTKYTYFMQIVLGICHLHHNGFIYRDVKPQNILIDVKGCAKICDFGFSRQIEQNQALNELCGSYQYIAPQVIAKQPYTKAIDIYCLGILFFQMINGSNPFAGINAENIAQISKRPIIFDRKKFSNSAKDLIQKMLKKNPKQRIGYTDTKQIFLDPFFKQNQMILSNAIANNVIPPADYKNHTNQEERNQVITEQPTVFKSKGYNYLTPSFDVTNKFGPKMSFNF